MEETQNIPTSRVCIKFLWNPYLIPLRGIPSENDQETHHETHPPYFWRVEIGLGDVCTVHFMFWDTEPSLIGFLSILYCIQCVQYYRTGRSNYSSVVVCKWRSGAEYLRRSSSSLCTAAAQFCCCHLTAAAAARSIKTDGESRSSKTAG